MPFKHLMFFMLSMVKESSQNALEHFFPKNKTSDAYEPTGIQFSTIKNKVVDKRCGFLGKERDNMVCKRIIVRRNR
jgi:hypothetical protein